nr:hypothetical protein [Tanacetum cinerariifolium]
MPGPKHPPSPVEIPYVPEPEYPEYLEPSDDEALLEDQPLPDDASPIAASPDYVADSDPEEDPEDDQADYPADGGDGDDEPSDDGDDDDTNDEDLEEEHLAPSDPSAVSIVDPVLPAGDAEALEALEADEPTHALDHLLLSLFPRHVSVGHERLSEYIFCHMPGTSTIKISLI